jgi:hypothetical protein
MQMSNCLKPPPKEFPYRDAKAVRNSCSGVEMYVYIEQTNRQTLFFVKREIAC